MRWLNCRILTQLFQNRWNNLHANFFIKSSLFCSLTMLSCIEMKEVFLVFLGGGLGSTLRYGIGRWVNSFFSPLLPYGTLVANLLACLVLGLLIGGANTRDLLSPSAKLFWIVGFCGGFSTFSAFSGETLALLQHGQTGTGLLYIGLSLALCLGATLAGMYLGQGT